jgi:uncharacterized membrane protein
MESDQNRTKVADSDRGELIERMILDIVHRQHITKVGDAVVSLQRLDGFLTTQEIHDAIKRLEERDEVNLSEEKINPSFLRNLAEVEVNAPFWLAIITTAAILIATFALPQDGVWLLAKRIVGAMFLFVIPGYTIINVLVARNRLSYVERMAISVGLSLASVSLIGMILAYGFAGIRLEPIIASMTAFVSVMAFIGAYINFRRRQQARIFHARFLSDSSPSRSK